MAILAVWALLLTVPVSAPPVPFSAAACTQAAPGSVRTASLPGVVVRLGDASLEEYQGGDPASRVQLTRSN